MIENRNTDPNHRERELIERQSVLDGNNVDSSVERPRDGAKGFVVYSHIYSTTGDGTEQLTLELYYVDPETGNLLLVGSTTHAAGAGPDTAAWMIHPDLPESAVNGFDRLALPIPSRFVVRGAVAGGGASGEIEFAVTGAYTR